MKVSIPHALRLGQRILAAQGVPQAYDGYNMG